MPQSKYNCKKCRRLVSLTSPSCPFCNTPNPNYQQPMQAMPQSTATSQPQNARQPSANVKTDMSDPVNQEISIEDMETLYHDPVPVKQNSINKGTDGTDQDEGLGPEPDPTVEAVAGRETNTISSSSEAHRSPIDWRDEKNHDTPSSYTEMFNENGVYQANYDGYYNDTLPKIQGEIDRILAGREKTFLKVVFTIIVIFAIIIYLILTI